MPQYNSNYAMCVSRMHTARMKNGDGCLRLAARMCRGPEIAIATSMHTYCSGRHFIHHQRRQTLVLDLSGAGKWCVANRHEADH